MTDVRILIRPGPSESPRRVTKVVPYASGGFAVLTPYHSARKGWLAKVHVDYNKLGRYTIQKSECVEYEANDRVKLSYHPDGFVQFSGENPTKIRSGRERDGSAKGLGLITSPLATPITTGPSFWIIVWGIADYPEDKKTSPTDMLFEDSEFYYKDCTPTTCNAYGIVGFVFPNIMWSIARKRSAGGYSLHTARPELAGGVYEWRIIELPNQPSFIGVAAHRLRVEFPTKSGFNLNGPGTPRDKNNRGNVLMAIYPGPKGNSPTSLDFSVPDTSEQPKP